MSKLHYINCQFCGKFFGFDPKYIQPDGTVLLTCPSCRKMFATKANPGEINIPQPAQTAPIDAPNEFDELISES